MAYDGKILARAREAVAQKKLNNEAELLRRRAEVSERAPELSSLEREMTRLMTDVALLALKQGEDAGKAVMQAKNRSGEILKRRASLLRRNGFPEDYIDDIFSCPKCRDTGYIEGGPCECLKEAIRAETVKELSCTLNIGNQCFERFDLSLYEPKNSGESLQSVQNAMLRLLNNCREYSEHFGEHSDNLLFRGGTGLGKTFLSACIAKVVSEKGFSVVYDTCVSVMDAFEAQKFDRNAGNSDETSAQVKRYLNCDLLILDDLGTEMTTAFTQSALYTLINARLAGGRKTIISANLTDEELEKRYSTQLVSRIRGEYEVLQFRGRDIRMVKKDRGL